MLFVALHAAKRNLLKAIQVARYRGVSVSDAHHFSPGAFARISEISRYFFVDSDPLLLLGQPSNTKCRKEDVAECVGGHTATSVETAAAQLNQYASETLTRNKKAHRFI